MFFCEAAHCNSSVTGELRHKLSKLSTKGLCITDSATQKPAPGTHDVWIPIIGCMTIPYLPGNLTIAHMGQGGPLLKVGFEPSLYRIICICMSYVIIYIYDYMYIHIHTP